MGGSTSTEYRYYDDPAVAERIREQEGALDRMKEQIADARAKAEKQRDPKYFREQQKAALDGFITNLGRMQFTSMLPAQFAGHRNVAVMGDVSVGKSSLLNALFGLQRRCGTGHTTETIEPTLVGNVVLWDSPGANNDLSFFEVRSLNMIWSMDLILVLYESSLCTADAVVRTALAIKGTSKVVFVRTQCDRHDPRKDSKTLAEEVAADRLYLASLGARAARIALTSKNGGFDHEALKAVVADGTIPAPSSWSGS